MSTSQHWTIKFGKSLTAQHFRLPESFLLQIPYFKQILAGQSSTEKVMSLSEDNLAAFAEVGSFMSTGQFSISITLAKRTRRERKKSARHRR
jgi:hypothetical protein